MDFATLRNYLNGPARPTPRDVMMDAVVFMVPGALVLLRFLLEMRVNRRTLRSLAEVTAAFTGTSAPRWMNVLTNQLWNMYRLAHIQKYILLGFV